MNAKIRQAQLMKVPYMAVVGDQEMQGQIVALRKRTGERMNDLLVDAFIAQIQEKVRTRSKTL
jgi:threonyl-tRNA synthetase